MWCMSAIHVVYVCHTCGVCQPYMWCMSAIHVVYVNHTCGVCQPYMWCMSAIHVVYVGHTCGVCLPYMWCMYVAIHVVFPICTVPLHVEGISATEVIFSNTKCVSHTVLYNMCIICTVYMCTYSVYIYVWRMHVYMCVKIHYTCKD